MPFETYGYEPVGRPLSGTLGARTSRPHSSGQDVPAWDYYLRDGGRELERIKDGYSGAPVYDPRTGNVVAVITHRKGDDKGFAIDLANLVRVYPEAGRRWFADSADHGRFQDLEPLDEQDEPGEDLVKTLDHEQQLATIDQWFKTSASGYGVALVEACADDCADYLADHVCLKKDLGDCSASSGHPLAATPVQVNPLYDEAAFREGLKDAIPGLHEVRESALDTGINGFLQGAAVHVFYVPVDLERYGLHLPALIRGAHQTLLGLIGSAPDTRILVLFAAIARQRPPFWWPWYRRWTIERLECCRFIGRLRRLTKADIEVWHAGFPHPLRAHYKHNELRRELVDLFADDQAEIHYIKARDCLLSYGEQAGAIARARRRPERR
jgi:hypothetical protein